MDGTLTWLFPNCFWVKRASQGRMLTLKKSSQNRASNCVEPRHKYQDYLITFCFVDLWRARGVAGHKSREWSVEWRLAEGETLPWRFSLLTDTSSSPIRWTLPDLSRGCPAKLWGPCLNGLLQPSHLSLCPVPCILRLKASTGPEKITCKFWLFLSSNQTMVRLFLGDIYKEPKCTWVTLNKISWEL